MNGTNTGRVERLRAANRRFFSAMEEQCNRQGRLGLAVIAGGSDLRVSLMGDSEMKPRLMYGILDTLAAAARAVDLKVLEE